METQIYHPKQPKINTDISSKHGDKPRQSGDKPNQCRSGQNAEGSKDASKRKETHKIQGIEQKVSIKTFPGAGVDEMTHYVKLTLQKKPKQIILHIGTNDLQTKSPDALIKAVTKLGEAITQETSGIELTLSEVVTRNDDLQLADKDEMVGFDFYEFVHRKDLTMVKTQLATTASESNEEKTDSKNSFILEEGIENSGNLCPGAKRSFLCRMKKGAKADDIMSMGTKTSITKTKGNVMVDETDPILSYTYWGIQHAHMYIVPFMHALYVGKVVLLRLYKKLE
ncbi:Scavenger receptor cysteine-rich type 1 M130 [Paramuricea clavata]|uniref:Scavenger receptor cysteine-rich type 1 M130 n=1 Tax=Paramuricea clavata TaxID=317549 RepID=A0A7D9L054_PARCT|nr:Scavenger receptor cysteine-rich type 1 M130 [Paramuricea clavata]